MRRTVVALLISLGLALSGQQASASAPVAGTLSVDRSSAAVQVSGQVAVQMTYSVADLVALPQTTLPLGAPGGGANGSVTGVPLLDLVQRSAPALDTQKNPQLRVWVMVNGAWGRSVRFALGELDPGFGDHPALLTVRTGYLGQSVELVVPGDGTRLRSVLGVTSVQVAVSAVGPVGPATAGAVQVTSCRRTVSLSADALARLPSRTRPVSFLAGTTPQQHSENGPSLAAVLLAARIVPLPNTVVTAIGADGYGAAVTVGEALFGSRPLLLSLAEDGVALGQPRLVPDGDVKGGRYVSGVVVLVVVDRDC